MATVDLHCHTRASADSIVDPAALVVRAAERGLTHLAITDHDTLDGALRARDAAPAGLTVIIGCEVLTVDGDLIFAFLDRALAPGLSARDAIAAGREQGALVGIPHPYDRTRRSLLRTRELEALASEVDWIEAWNGRVSRREENALAAALARRIGIPAVGVSDAHSLLELGTASTVMTGDPATPAGLRAALRGQISIQGAGPAADADGPFGTHRGFRWLRRGGSR